ncbi:hypothetical protein BGX33_006931 [Mortierella sp. NVP41]|nr:hypothetical protein BGX33_006931 [Mortierella sp. NVP41]
MRGRLPETKPRAVLPDWGFDPVVWRQHHATDIPDEPTDEESIVQEHIFEIKDNIQKSLSEPLAKIAPYCLTPNEYLSLLDIARVIQQDMQTLQDGLSRCGRPPDQRDGDYIPAPIWDAAYLTEIINAWNEPVALEPDYYLLRSMCLYELGVSIQVSVLGQEKVQRYMNMALTLAQRGERILKTKLGPGDGAVKFWRYQTMMSYIYQYQAKMAITAIKRRRELTGLLDQAAVDQACDLASRALRCFHRGMRYHPNVMSTGTGTEEPFKDEEWIKMTDLAESCFHLVDDIATCRTWCRHTLKLLLGALYENRAQAGRFLGLIAKTQLEYAVWIHEQKETPLVVVPKPCPLFLEMRHASIAGKSPNFAVNVCRESFIGRTDRAHALVKLTKE